jgi:hypothetical protein
MKFRNIILVIALASTSFVACKKQIDIEPRGAINPASLGQNEVEQLLIGVYKAFQNAPGNYSFVLGDIRGENLINSNLFNSGDIVELVQNNIKTSNALVYQIWTGYYKGIFRANTLIETLGNLTQTQRNKELMASAKYLRAYGYFNLVKNFGGVPLLDKPTSELVKRSTAQETYAFIKNDLLTAITDFPSITTISTDRQHFVSKEAGKALLARVALYTGDNSTAKTLAEELINSGTFSLEPNFADVYHKPANKEIIFSFKNLNSEGTDLYSLFTTNAFPQRGSYVYYPTTEFQNLLTAGDTRTTTSFISYSGQIMVNKILNYEPVIVSRIAEMYLISAEAQGLAGILRLNQLREARGLSALIITDPSDYLNAILLERRRELFIESHRLYDLIRTNKAIGTLTTITDANKLLLPIPQQEIDVYNNTALLPQNPGY